MFPTKKNGNKHLPEAAARKMKKNTSQRYSLFFHWKTGGPFAKRSQPFVFPFFRQFFHMFLPKFPRILPRPYQRVISLWQVQSYVPPLPGGINGVVCLLGGGWTVGGCHGFRCLFQPLPNIELGWLARCQKLLKSQILCLIQIVGHFHPHFFRRTLCFFWGNRFTALRDCWWKQASASLFLPSQPWQMILHWRFVTLKWHPS